MNGDSATEILAPEKVVTIHRPGYDEAGKPSLITGERILTDKEMRDMAVQQYKVLDRAFRICLASKFRMIQRCDPNSDIVTQAIERFINEASK